MEAPKVDNLLQPDTLESKTEGESLDVSIKIDWEEEDKAAVDAIKQQIDQQLQKEYVQAFAVENKLLAKVRVKSPMTGMWVQNPDGSYVEDWEKITIKELENFIEEATAWTFFASQQVIDSYADAVFAKYTYDDSYDIEYSAQIAGTVGDKTAKAKRRTKNERWIALYRSLYYKKAKEVVDRLDQHVRRIEKIYAERQKEAEREFRAGRL